MITKDFNSIIQLLEAFPNEQSCIDHLTNLRWNGNVISPFNKTSIVYKCKGNKYKCKETGKYFNVKTGTFLDNTKIKLQKWFLAVWLITGHKKGISSLQLGRDIDVTQKTAWFMLHRIRNCFKLNNEPMTGIVEIDESGIGGKESNKHDLNKSPNPMSSNNKATILGMMKRGETSTVKAKLVNARKSKYILPEVMNAIKPGTVVMTDGLPLYKRLNGYYEQYTVNHKTGEYVRGLAHTNTIEGFWSLLKRGIVGIYHSTSKKHMQMYVDEFVFRYNTRNLVECNRLNVMLSNSEYRLTYKNLINVK